MSQQPTQARLTPIWAIQDVGVLLSWGFRHRVAEEAATGIQLVASYGRSRSGTGSRYVLVVPTPTGETYHRFKADGDRAAVAHAEAYLAKRARQEDHPHA